MLLSSDKYTPSNPAQSMPRCHPNIGEIDRILARARHPEMVAFVSHYRAVHPVTGLPSRVALDLAHRPLLRPYCILVDVEGRYDPQQQDGAAMDFRIAEAGAEVTKASRYALVGRRFSEIIAQDDPGFGYVATITGEVVRSRQPIYHYGPTRLQHRGDYGALEYCSCPLASDGSTIDGVVCCILFLPGDESLGWRAAGR